MSDVGRQMLDVGCWMLVKPGAQTKQHPTSALSRLDENVLLLRPEDPIPSWDDLAACSGTRQGFPPGRANTARGPDGTRCKPGTPFSSYEEMGTLGIAYRGHFY